MVKPNDLDREIAKRLETFEKQVSWSLLLIFLICLVIIYQIIFNIVFASVIYNPALGDTPVQYATSNQERNVEDTDSEPEVVLWKENDKDLIRSQEKIPMILGVLAPQFYFVAVIAALALGMYNIRRFLLLKFAVQLRQELSAQNDWSG